MKAKFGKLSIGFFIAMIIIVTSLIAKSRSDELLRVILVAYFMLPLLGVIFALLGLVKKEKPKVYYIIGIILNLFYLVAFLYVLLRSLPGK